MPREDFNVGSGVVGWALRRKPNYFHYVRKADDKSLTDEQALRMYTSNTYYKSMNKSLRTDAASLSTDGERIGAVRRAIRGHTVSGTVYRGVRLCNHQLSDYQPGFRFLWPAFTSTSWKKSKADDFGSWTSGGRKVLFKINLDGQGLTYARDIAEFSVYPDEAEVVIYPYSGFEVLSRYDNGDTVFIDLCTVDTLIIEEENK